MRRLDIWRTFGHVAVLSALLYAPCFAQPPMEKCRELATELTSASVALVSLRLSIEDGSTTISSETVENYARHIEYLDLAIRNITDCTVSTSTRILKSAINHFAVVQQTASQGGN